MVLQWTWLYDFFLTYWLCWFQICWVKKRNCSIIFFMIAFEKFSVTALEKFQYIMPCCAFLHISLVRLSMSFLHLWFYRFHQIWNNAGLYYFTCFVSASLSPLRQLHVFYELWSCATVMLSSFMIHFSLCFKLESFYFYTFKFPSSFFFKV
jgi:hypothetical protein